MTRSNLHIKLSNGKSIICVADGSSAPEQGYIVETLLLPLLSLSNSEQERCLLRAHCTMNERRVNATYRYTINLITKEVKFFEEHYNYCKGTFKIGRNITQRYDDYLKAIDNK